jgi:hypothetical protein
VIGLRPTQWQIDTATPEPTPANRHGQSGPGPTHLQRRINATAAESSSADGPGVIGLRPTQWQIDTATPEPTPADGPGLSGLRPAQWQRRVEAVAPVLESAAAESTSANGPGVIGLRPAEWLRRVEAAANVLAPASAARSRGPAGLRAAAWHAEAVVRRARGDRTGALAAARAGLRVVEEHAASLGAADLRAHVSGHGVALAELGLGIALDAGRPADALIWADRLRARSLWRPAVRPPADPVLVGLLTRLRAAAEDGDAAEQVRLERAVQARARHAPGKPATDQEQTPARHTAGTDQEQRTSARYVAAAEQGRRARAQRATAEPGRRGRGGQAFTPDAWPGRLRDRLGPRALVCYLNRGDRLLAVTVVAGRHRVHDLGPWGPIGAELDWLRFAAHRIWRADTPAARAALRHSTETLDAALLGALPELTDRSLVAIPTAALHALPWAMLPSLHGRPTEVAPSLRLWLAPAPTTRRRGTLLAAGPGLRHANREITTLARLHPDADVLRGPAATVDAVLAGLNHAAVAHLACHGHFRADNPQFSALTLADGPLTVYDLARLTHPPRLLVLSACEAARCADLPGDELLGLTAALCSLGTRTLIAPVMAVPDAATRPLMVDLHRRLLADETPAAALAAASSTADLPGFVCLGAG